MSYEFDSVENQQFAGLAQWLLIAAIMSAVYAVVNLAVGLSNGDLTVIPGSVGSAILVFLLFNSRGACNKVIDTQGDDVQHAMAALDSLKIYFWVQAILFLVLILLMLLVITGAIVIAGAM